MSGHLDIYVHYLRRLSANIDNSNIKSSYFMSSLIIIYQRSIIFLRLSGVFQNLSLRSIATTGAKGLEFSRSQIIVGAGELIVRAFVSLPIFSHNSPPSKVCEFKAHIVRRFFNNDRSTLYDNIILCNNISHM